MSKKYLIKIGDKFGLLTILETYIKNKKDNKFYCKCQCECGKILLRRHESLLIRRNINQTCGKGKCKGKFCPKGETHPCWKGYGDICGDYISILKRRYKDKYIDFDIDAKFLHDLLVKQNYKCALSGIEIAKKTTKNNLNDPSENTASLDRIDSSKGYTKDNVQWIHKDINKMKNSYNQQYFINICNKIAQQNPIYLG